jgi:hypothetical protein
LVIPRVSLEGYLRADSEGDARAVPAKKFPEGTLD